MNLIKVLSCRFQQCLGTFVILLDEASSETRFFRHLCNNAFRVRNFGNTKSMKVIFFSKCWKFNVNLKNAAKNWEKHFCFSDNCIWIGIVKLSLLRTGYFSAVANVLTCNPKIFHVNKRDFFNLISLALIEEYDKGAVIRISTVLVCVYHIASQRVLRNETF